MWAGDTDTGRLIRAQVDYIVRLTSKTNKKANTEHGPGGVFAALVGGPEGTVGAKGGRKGNGE